MSTPLPATGRPADIAALLTPDGALGTAGLLAVDSAEGPGQQATPQTALAAAGDGRSTDQQVELSWSQANPVGKTDDAEGELDLWNFDVASAQLKQDHVLALAKFMRIFVMLASTPPGGAVATGYASSTGGRQANLKLAEQRAQAVADWCDQNGVPGVAVKTGGIQPGDDGESFARARSVHLVINEPPPAPVETPRYKLLPGTKSTPPVAAQCGMQNTIDLIIGPVKFYTLPPNGWLDGDFSFTGTARLTFKDPQACLQAQESINATTSAGSLKITQQVSDALALRFSANGQWDKNATLALTALVGTDRWEIGLQSDANFIVVKSPAFPLTDLLRGLVTVGPDALKFNWDGADFIPQAAGQFQFAGRPGPLLADYFSEWAAGLEISAAEGVMLVGALAQCAAIFYLTMDAAVHSDAEGERRAALIGQRLGFGAEIAVFITKDATDQDADRFLAAWDEPHLRETRNIIDQARKDASDQLDALGDQRKDKVTALSKEYTKDASGDAFSYHTVATKLFFALGGNSNAGDPPSLDKL